ncbi:MAG: hypothetical protein JNK57_11205 [Planctomycetaceae bacterium]|nr:hypothetical protein [Planctomycetaceae bacterium]
MSNITLGIELNRIVRRCETVCDAACCGLEAFDFHPIHMASALLGFADRDPAEVVDSVERNLRDLELLAQNQALDEFGDLGWSEQLNTTFTRETLSQWIFTIRNCLMTASQLLAFSESLGFPSRKFGST